MKKRQAKKAKAGGLTMGELAPHIGNVGYFSPEGTFVIHPGLRRSKVRPSKDPVLFSVSRAEKGMLEITPDGLNFCVIESRLVRVLAGTPAKNGKAPKPKADTKKKPKAKRKL